ncbi:MAG: M14 family zinc carboxypeptidase [Clostridia bacterium]|nr:M14 family zinc carboxypeptidase [Clostridia bacterium]
MKNAAISIEDRLAKVPEYTRFVTVDQLYARAHEAAAAHPEFAKLTIVGKSTAGSEIPMISIGGGPASVLVFACPHPNEPIGAMMTYFLMDELVTDEQLRAGRTWHILPCVDPDGTRLNEGWFAGPFSIRNYARGFYRPRPQDQVEWTFPIEYKTLKWDNPKPETQALMKAIEQTRPDVMYSLHNAGFGGAYYYMTDGLGTEHYAELHRIPVERGIALSLGEPEMPWSIQLYPGVFKETSVTDSYDYYSKFAPGDPAQYIVGGAGSSEWAKNVAHPFSLVTEVPYFMSAKIGDQTPTARTRRDVILEGISKSRHVYDVLSKALEATKDLICTGSGPLLRGAVATFVEAGRKSLPSQERWARETPGMEQLATVAQAADSLYVEVFYRMLVASMLARAVEGELKTAGAEGQEPGAKCCGSCCGQSRQATLRRVLDELRMEIDGWASEIEENLAYEVVPIRNLVQVQYGALLVVLEARGL